MANNDSEGKQYAAQEATPPVMDSTGTDYYVVLVRALMDSYMGRAIECRNKKDEKQEMFFVGKAQALNESLSHYMEFRNEKPH